MKALVSPPTETDWRISRSEFSRGMEAEFDGCEFSVVPDDTSEWRDLDWSMEASFGLLHGHLAGEGQVLVLDGDVRDIAKLAIWFRTMVPMSQDLVFYDEGYSADASIGETTTAEELARLFLG